MELVNKILNTIQYYGMMQKGDRVMVAVSGGPDSVSLADILNRLKNKLGIKLYIGHIDHGIRGAESRADSVFVKKMARSLEIKSVFGKMRLAAKNRKISLEEDLRYKRYEFFKKAARKLRANVVATAHTLDDQAETVLMRIIKGASLKGLVGIHPVRQEGNLKLVRPLIEVEKKHIISYLESRKIGFRTDRTNLEDDYLRNRIRNKVLPYLEKVNPRVRRSLFNLAESLREDFEFIEEEKARKKASIRSKRDLRYIMLADIMLQPRALRKEIIREAIKSAGGDIKKLTFRHWKDADIFLRKKKTGKSMDLPGGIKLKKTRDRLILSR